MKRALASIGASIRDSPSEVRSRCINAVHHLIDLNYADQDEKTLALTEKWFRSLTPKPIDLFLQLSGQPFPELRCAALRIFQSLARQQWGRLALNNHPGFNEYLLDRSTESDKQGKEHKYEIVRTLVEAKDSDEIFGRPYVLKLKVYQNEGPFFVRAQAEVAMESQ